jgi:Synergist-CTERM protein sorting domain-containing protein
MITTHGFARLVVARPATARSCLHTALLAVIVLAGCVGVDEPDYGITESAVSVGSYQTSTCSTSVVIGLSKQVAEEVGCMNPSSLVKFTPTKNLQITSTAVLPFLHSGAKTDLEKVAETRVVQINSAFRTVVQQYLLYRWFQLGRCGISAAATPGRSNHESGRALDVANYSNLVTAMSNRGWAHDVPGDPVHFDHLSSPDIRGKDVLAFQRLWNRNNKADLIAEDGVYGPQTEARVKASPATGFGTGATCVPRNGGADVLMVEGPDKIAPGAKAHFSLTVQNNDAVDWSANTRLLVSGGGTSELYDSDSWVSPSEVGTIGSDIGAGAMGVIELDVRAPMVTEETPLFTQLTLDDGGQNVGTIDIAVTVTPNGDEGTSGDNGDTNDNEDLTGGCSAGGGASWPLALLIPLIVVRKRRR